MHIVQVRELDLPLKHNQITVVKFITLIRDDERYWCNELFAEGKSERRWEILTTKVILSLTIHPLKSCHTVFPTK